MKKLLAVTVLAVVALSVLAFIQLQKNSSDTAKMEDIALGGDYIAEDAAEEQFSVQVEAAEIIPSVAQEIPTGDMTIRNAVRLNLSNASSLGPLVGGRLVYFRQVGNPLYYTDENGGRTHCYETEIRLVNCADGTDSVIYTIYPAGETLCASGLDNTNAYMLFSSAEIPVDSAADDAKVNAQLYESGRVQTSAARRSILLQINVQNSMIKEFTLPLGDGEVSEIVPLGSRNLLIHSYVYPEEEKGELNSILTSERMDILDLSDGNMRNFYSGNISSEYSAGNNTVEINFVSASEDKVYFSTKTIHDGLAAYGFRVYDSDMNFIHGEDVTTLKEYEATSATAEMGVSNGNIFYKINRDIDDGKQSYYKYSPTTMGYTQVPFENDSGNYEYNQMTLYSANPRNSTVFDYSFLQGNDESGVSHVYLSNSAQNTYYQLEIDVPGFRYPRFINSYYPIVTDFNGDFLLLSAGSDYYDSSGFKKPFEYFYVPATEMRRALFGNQTVTDSEP